MENVLKNGNPETLDNCNNESIESSQSNIKDLGAKDINAITNSDDVVFYHSGSSCSC